MFLDELVQRYVDQGVATKGTTLFWGSMAQLPTGDGPFLVVRTYTGLPGSRTHNLGAPLAYEEPRAQVVAHGAVPSAVWTLAKAAYDASNVVNVELSSVPYLRLGALQLPFDMGLDASGRARIGFNVGALKRPS